MSSKDVQTHFLILRVILNMFLILDILDEKEDEEVEGEGSQSKLVW